MRVATRRLEKSRQYVKSIRCKRASLIQPQQTQSAFHAVHNETLSAAPDVDPQVRNSFRRLHNKLKMRRTAPMWRNGRRNGLKIRWAVKGPCRFESGHRQFFTENVNRSLHRKTIHELRIA